MNEFAGKTVWVTGATSGIGRAVALGFLQQGAVVGVNHLHDPAAFSSFIDTVKTKQPDALSRVIELPGDVRRRDQVMTMADTLMNVTGSLDVLVNNAGISQIKPFLEVTDSDWRNIMDTDLTSVFLCCQAAIPHLLKSAGSIVNVASELALTGRAQFVPYTAAKGGIISLSRSLAREFAPAIRVNVVAPGPTQTPMLDAEASVPGHQEPVDDVPLQRVATAGEIADSILFLASDKASYFCGDVISPNGGSVMR